MSEGLTLKQQDDNYFRHLLRKSRSYVADALEAHEHSDGRELLTEVDAAMTPTPPSDAEVMHGCETCDGEDQCTCHSPTPSDAVERVAHHFPQGPYWQPGNSAWAGSCDCGASYEGTNLAEAKGAWLTHYHTIASMPDTSREKGK